MCRPAASFCPHEPELKAARRCPPAWSAVTCGPPTLNERGRKGAVRTSAKSRRKFGRCESLVQFCIPSTKPANLPFLAWFPWSEATLTRVGLPSGPARYLEAARPWAMSGGGLGHSSVQRRVWLLISLVFPSFCGWLARRLVPKSSSSLTFPGLAATGQLAKHGGLLVACVWLPRSPSFSEEVCATAGSRGRSAGCHGGSRRNSEAAACMFVGQHASGGSRSCLKSGSGDVFFRFRSPMIAQARGTGRFQTFDKSSNVGYHSKSAPQPSPISSAVSVVASSRPGFGGPPSPA